MLNLQVAIIADTTGSMLPCIREVRHNIEKFCGELRDKRDINAEFAVLTHGDYCDGYRAITTLDFTQNWVKLQEFIRNAPDTNGGDSPECYELALHVANDFAWRDGWEKIIVMFGDDIPHPVNYYDNKNKLDWRTEINKLSKQKGITMYAVQCLGRRHATNFWQELAQLGNGYYLQLSQFSDAISMIEAAVAQKGNYLPEFTQELQSTFRFNRGIAEAINTLSRGKLNVSVRAVDNGLIPVSPYRFQVLAVPYVIDIKSFVEQSGATFAKGRGFYQFTKTEEIQERKEVVLVDKETGDMFTGPGARELIGLPFGKRGKLRPVFLNKYNVFVQSTSNNRKLMANTKFLYEITDRAV